MDWRAFAKWMSGKVAFQAFALGISAGLFGLAWYMSRRSSGEGER